MKDLGGWHLLPKYVLPRAHEPKFELTFIQRCSCKKVKKTRIPTSIRIATSLGKPFILILMELQPQ